MYALVDCNNFYVSCERVFQPHLNGKPVVVLSNNDGCIISRSYEAKALGIPMGAPEFECRQTLKQHKVHVFSSNYTLYGDLSDRVIRLLGEFTPEVEAYSIDEAFLDLNGITITDYEKYGLNIKRSILKWLSLPTCIGIAKTKSLSKVANKIAKRFQDRTGGVYVIDSEEKRIKALQWTKIEEVWGIGYRLTKKLKAKGIHTALDYVLPQHESFIKKELGVVGMRLKYELEGRPILQLEDVKTKKNIAITRTFKKSTSDYEEIRERVSTFASVCAEKLRKQQSCCYQITLYLRKNKYQDKNNSYNRYSSVVLPYASQSGLTISNAALNLLKTQLEFGEVYTKAGVIVSQLIPENAKQFHLFEEENYKHTELMKAIDACNRKIGETKVKIANQDLKQVWIMNQNHLSKNYTTHANDIIHVKCH